MTQKFIYSGKAAEVTDASGTQGVLIRNAKGEFLFRVYNEDADGDEFTDYEIRHDDLSVQIDFGELAAFYKVGDKLFLDHDPETLGLEEEK